MNKLILLCVLAILVIVVLSAMFFLKDSWKVIDLRRSMPKGNFLEARIVDVDFKGRVIDHGWFEIPRDRIREFEEKFRKCVEKARSDKQLTPVGIMRMNQLRIITDKGRYAMYVVWTDDYMLFDGRGRTLESKDIRQLFLEMGLKKISLE